MFSFHHVSISVKDVSKSIEFYSVFGFHKVFEWAADDGSLTITHLKLGACILEMFSFAQSNPPSPSTRTLETDLPVIGIRHFGLQVASIEEAKKSLTHLGYAVDAKPTKGRTGIEYFFLKDPDGIFVEILQDDRQLS